MSLKVFIARFFGLSDTPNTGTGHRGDMVVVNNQGNGIGFMKRRASNISYNDSNVSFSATNMQQAIESLNEKIDSTDTNVGETSDITSQIDKNSLGVLVRHATTGNRFGHIEVTGTAGQVAVSNPGGHNTGNAANVIISIPDPFEVPGEQNVSGNQNVSGDITVGGTIDGIDVSQENERNLKRSGGQANMEQPINMGNFKITGLSPGSDNSDAVTHSQVVRITENQTISGDKDFIRINGTVATIKDHIPEGEEYIVNNDEQMIVGSGYRIDGELKVEGTMFIIK